MRKRQKSVTMIVDPWKSAQWSLIKTTSTGSERLVKEHNLELAIKQIHWNINIQFPTLEVWSQGPQIYTRESWGPINQEDSWIRWSNFQRISGTNMCRKRARITKQYQHRWGSGPEAKNPEDHKDQSCSERFIRSGGWESQINMIGRRNRRISKNIAPKTNRSATPEY